MAVHRVGVRAHAVVWLVALLCVSACSGSVTASAAASTGGLALRTAVPVTTVAGSTPAANDPAASQQPPPSAAASTTQPNDPSPSASATPPPSTPPNPPDEGGQQTPAGMSKQVLGFFLPGQMDYILHQTDFSVLSTIAYFGISSNGHGNLHRRVSGGAYDFRWSAWIGSRMTQIITKAHAAGTKVVLTVTRFSWTSPSYQTSVSMLSTSANRQRLANETAQAVKDRGVDGVNVDFEPIPSSQKANFVDFVRRLRTALDGVRHGLQLTVDTTGYIANYDVAGLTATGAADALFIMAYHYSGSWSNRAGAVSPLHRGSYDVTDTVDAFLRYTTADKLMLGLPYYGNTWATESSGLMAKTRPGSSSYGYPGSVIYSHAVGLAAAHGRLWDDVEKVPWTRWQARACSSCPLSWHQLYYEDAQSLNLKHDLVTAKGLRGTGVWTLGFGGNGPELNQELKNSFGSHH